MYSQRERTEIKIFILQSAIFTEFHYFISHFRSLKQNLSESFFLKSFLDHLQCIERKIPGFAKKFVTSFASISGKKSHEPHYEQLVQMLAELIVFGKLSYDFSSPDYSFKWEPIFGNSKKNPELSITSIDWCLLIEVKCPSFLKHIREASKHSIQLGARIGQVDFFNGLSDTGTATRPLDNKVKDYLISANEKFKTFKEEEPSTHTILILVWTQHRYEAVSPLMNGICGLFTENSYLKQDSGLPVLFPYVDGVIVTSHYDAILRGSRDEMLPPGFSNPLDFGNKFDPQYNDPIYIQNPASTNSRAVTFLDSFGALDYEEGRDPLVSAMDMIFWVR